MKKFLALILSLSMVLGLTACGGSSSSTASSAASSAPASSVSESVSAEPESTSAAPESAVSTEASPLDGIKFSVSKVRNDNTGNWRISLIAENIDMSEYALDYYKQYFTDDSEIHFIVNFNYNTTTKIMNMGGQYQNQAYGRGYGNNDDMCCQALQCYICADCCCDCI